MGDAEGMAALYEADAVLASGNGQSLVRRNAIRDFYTELIENSSSELRDLLQINGNLALTSTLLPNGTVTAEVARKQADGRWPWVIDQPSIGN